MTVKEECKMKRTCEKFQKWIAMILVLILFLQPLAECRVYAAENENFESVSENEGYRVIMETVSEWDNHANLQITVENTGDKTIDNWHIVFHFEGEIENIWNANVIASQNGRYAVKNNIWNQDIPVGGSVTFGLTCIFKEDRNEPDGFMLATDWIEASEESYSYKTEFNTTGDDSFYDAVLILQNESNEIIEI